MTKPTKKRNDNKLVLILRINGDEHEIAEFDKQKFDMINYYIMQNISEESRSQNDCFIKSIADNVVSGFNKNIEKQYKKYVPKDVRDFYENYLISNKNEQTEIGQVMDKTSAALPFPDEGITAHDE